MIHPKSVRSLAAECVQGAYYLRSPSEGASIPAVNPCARVAAWTPSHRASPVAARSLVGDVEVAVQVPIPKPQQFRSKYQGSPVAQDQSLSPSCAAHGDSRPPPGSQDVGMRHDARCLRIRRSSWQGRPTCQNLRFAWTRTIDFNCPQRSNQRCRWTPGRCSGHPSEFSSAATGGRRQGLSGRSETPDRLGNGLSPMADSGSCTILRRNGQTFDSSRSGAHRDGLERVAI